MRSRHLPMVATVMVVLLGLVFVPLPARAVYQCGGVQDTCQCGRDNFCICCSNATYGTDHGNCVWFGWHMACCEWGVGLPFCRNAELWDNDAISNGYTVLVGQPCARTIFVCEVNTTQCGSGGYGHVGWVVTAYPNGSIDVTEQGCYSWYGVKSRLINAQNASPAMKYIYQPGITSCVSCQCTVGAQESQGCGLCGTQSRTCGSDCQWGGWSACTGEGVCSPGAQESQGCGLCGTQSRACGSDCQWGGWSACTGEGVCSPGEEQPCGTCGGSQTCTESCQWGHCEEVCIDGGLPPQDAAAAKDGSTTLADGSPPGEDGSIPDPPDSGTGITGPQVRGGCQCGHPGGGAHGVPVPLFLVVFLILFVRLTHRFFPKQ